jgi:hypothetical protein
VQNDERDRAALDAAGKLAAQASELLGDSAGFTQIEQRQLVRALVAKAFDRRDDLREVTRRLTVELLDQTATRMSGKRA